MSGSDSTRVPRVADDIVTVRATKVRSKESIRSRLENWIAQLQQDPSAEEHAAQERRALLLKELNQTVADAPDDVPIKYVIERLNRHWED